MKNTSRKPYIYKVTNLETGKYYIGSQCSGKTLGANYFTSSTNKEFKEDFKNYGEEKYKITIIKEFENPEECVRVENYIIRNHMRLKNDLCLNRACHCNGEKIFSRAGLPAWNKGIPRSEEVKRKISKSNKGRPGWNKGLPGPNRGIHWSEETRQKMSASHKGIHHSDEDRKKMSEAKKIKISIEDRTFESITEAAQYYNVGFATVRYWIKTGNHNAFYIEK